MESSHAINTGELLSLSEQQLVDCATTFFGMPWNGGCNGGSWKKAFGYIAFHPSELEASYPYIGTDNTCYQQRDLGVVSTKVVTPYTKV